jgi:hypothetical protein
LQIPFDRLLRRGFGAKSIVGHAEPRGGIEVLAVLVIRKRTGLADQRVDHVPKVDPFLVFAVQSRDSLATAMVVPQLEMILMDMDFQPPSDVGAADGIRVLFDANHAVAGDCQGNDLMDWKSLGRQGTEFSTLGLEPRFARTISALRDLLQEGDVGFATIEIATATQPQRLIDAVLEVPM